jgi:hypothetical protein
VGLKIDGIATSEHIDSSGELLIIENHDISDLIEGKGVLNFEHSNKADDIIGAIIYAKKILKKSDCENDRQRKYWDTVEKPFVYIIGELYDDEEHPGAIAVAAMVRYYAKKSEKLLTGFSIEGATLERDDYILAESVGRRVACTLRPCNKTAIAGLLEDPKAKSIAKSIQEMADRVDHLIEVDSCILDEVMMPSDPILDLHKAVEELAKTLEAGNYNVAPSSLTQGAALQVEHISGFNRNRMKAAIRDWDRKRPLKEVIKAALPEVSDSYIDHFTHLAEDMALKKSMPSTKLTRVGAQHSPNMHQTDEQKKLIEGLYFDTGNKPKQYTPKHGEFSNTLIKLQNDAGQKVLVKPPRKGFGVSDSGSTDRADEEDEIGRRVHDNAQSATHYYHLADQVFGMGKHVPPTNYFKHDELHNHFAGSGLAHEGVQQGEHFQAMEMIPKAKTALTASDAEWNKMHKHMMKNGDLHKLMMMDTILGNIDRHQGNFLIHPKGHIINIDNDLAFSHGKAVGAPDYIGDKGLEEPVHEEAANWIKGIDPKILVGKMLDQGHDPATIKRSVAALKMFQKLAARPGTTVRQAYASAVGAATAGALYNTKKVA